MSSRRAALVLACVAVSGGALGACGGSNDYIDSVPKSTPDLTVPSNGTGLPPPQTTSTTSTTDTTATTPTPSSTSPGTGGTAVTRSTAAPSQSTGGTPSGGTTTTPTQTTPSNSGGTPAGGFSDFCKQNPGACGQ
jgi:hypothetical protein